MGEVRKYSMLVFSNPVEGNEDPYLEWYAGQHIHDLLNIPGFMGCRFYKVSQHQLFGDLESKGFRYLMIWDWETDDIDEMYREFDRRKKDGRWGLCPFFKNQLNFVCLPVTEYITPAQVAGMNVGEVAEYSQLVKKLDDVTE